MGYAEITRCDRNPVKRFIHQRRLLDAFSMIPPGVQPRTLVDFGAGDGYFSKHLGLHFHDADVFCYEPVQSLRQDAAEVLQGIPNVRIVSGVDELPHGQCDLLFCLEVLEHLPEAQVLDVALSIKRVLTQEGLAVVGVPIEIFLPALAKGLFRMARNYGDFDAQLSNVLRAALGAPPSERPVSEIAPGMFYHYHHMGFDHRSLIERLSNDFDVLRTGYSPVKAFGAVLNSEIYYLLRKR